MSGNTTFLWFLDGWGKGVVGGWSWWWGAGGLGACWLLVVGCWLFGIGHFWVHLLICMYGVCGLKCCWVYCSWSFWDGPELEDWMMVVDDGPMMRRWAESGGERFDEVNRILLRGSWLLKVWFLFLGNAVWCVSSGVIITIWRLRLNFECVTYLY